jgi:uncharacterized protein YbaP (TraB family)
MRARTPRGRITCVVWALVLSCLATQGCATRQGALAKLEELGPNGAMPLFWRVDATEGASLYVLGSVHLGPAEGWQFPPAIHRAFEHANAIAVEVDPTEMHQAAQQMLVARYGMLPPGVTLEQLLSPETWAMLKKQTEQAGLPLDAVERMQPWLVTNLLMVAASRRLGWSPQGGVDATFIGAAGDRSIVSLESAEFQLSLLAGLPAEIQELSLRDTLGRFDDVSDYLTRLVGAWRIGDEAALEDFFFASYDEDPAFEPFFEILIFRRNQSMAERLRVLLDAEQHRGEIVFVVIGAGHVIGSQGVPAILASWGYPVVRLSRDELESPLSGDSHAGHR